MNEDVDIVEQLLENVYFLFRCFIQLKISLLKYFRKIFLTYIFPPAAFTFTYICMRCAVFKELFFLDCLHGPGHVSRVGNVFLWNTKQLPQHVGCRCLSPMGKFVPMSPVKLKRDSSREGKEKTARLTRQSTTLSFQFVAVKNGQNNNRWDGSRELSRWRQKEWEK